MPRLGESQELRVHYCIQFCFFIDFEMLLAPFGLLFLVSPGLLHHMSLVPLFATCIFFILECGALGSDALAQPVGEIPLCVKG
jgi:hypothetical protein